MHKSKAPKKLVLNAAAVVVQGVLLHLGYDGWWEQDMQELPLKRMSDAKVLIFFKFVYVTRQIAAEL